MSDLRLNVEQLIELRGIWLTHLPADAAEYVFRSRASGIGIKPHSELDLLVGGSGKLPVHALADAQPTRHAIPAVMSVISFRGCGAFDTCKPNSTRRNVLDPYCPAALGWGARTLLCYGTRMAHELAPLHP